MENQLLPSILASDITNIRNDIELFKECGLEYLHCDICDGHFVPSITYGVPVVEAINNYTDMKLDVHLMCEEPSKYIDSFIKAGADIITIHAESAIHLHRTIYQIKNQGIKAGIALNPATSEDILKYLINDVDMVLCMSVNPGFGGQAFIPSVVDKIKCIRDINDKVIIEVDGGVSINNVEILKNAGANMFVVGSALYKGDIKENINNINNIIK